MRFRKYFVIYNLQFRVFLAVVDMDNRVNFVKSSTIARIHSSLQLLNDQRGTYAKDLTLQKLDAEILPSSLLFCY